MPSPPLTKDAPERLDQDMKVADLIEVLERLPFGHSAELGRSGPTHCLIQIDRGVRDYILRAIKPR